MDCTCTIRRYPTILMCMMIRERLTLTDNAWAFYTIEQEKEGVYKVITKIDIKIFIYIFNSLDPTG